MKRLAFVLLAACAPASSAPPVARRAPSAAPTDAPTDARGAPRPIPSDAVYNAFAEDGGLATASSAEPDAGGAPDVPAATVTVLAPGAAPRRTFAYAFAATPRTVRCALTLASGATAPTSIELTFLATPKPTAGGATFDVSVTKVHIGRTPAMPESAVAEVEASLVGRRGSFEASKDGTTTAFAAASAPKAGEQLAEFLSLCLDNELVMWPKDAIGVGAKWTVAQTTTGSGASGMVTTTFTLEAADASTETVSIGVAGARTTAVADPRAPAGTTVTLSSSGTYRVVARRDGIARKFEATTQSVVTQRVPSQPDQTVRVGTTVKAESR